MASVGFLTLDIIPSVKNITSEIQSQVIAPATKGGAQAGEEIRKGITKASNDGAVSAGKVIQAEVSKAGAKAGTDAGRSIQSKVADAGARGGREAGDGVASGLVPRATAAAERAGAAIARALKDGGDRGGRDAGNQISTAITGLSNVVSKDLGNIQAGLGGVSGKLGSIDSSLSSTSKGFGIFGATAAAGALVAAAGLALVPAAFAAIGIAAVASNAQVQTSFTNMKTGVLQTVRDAAAPIVPVLVGSMDQVAKKAQELGPLLGQGFSAVAPQLGTLIQGVLAAVTNALPGVVSALGSLMPVTQALAQGLGQIGTGLGQFFTAVGSVAGPAGVALGSLMTFVAQLLPLLGQLLSALLSVGAPLLQTLLPALTNLLNVVGGALIDMFMTLAPVLLNVATAMTPVIFAIGGLIQVLAPAIGSVFGALGNLLVALAPMFVQIVNAVLPLIPAFISLISPVTTLVPVIAQVATTLVTALAPILQRLIPIIADIASVFLKFAGDALMKLAGAVVPLLPVIGNLAQILGGALLRIVTGLAPVLDTLVNAIIAILPPIVGLLPIIANFAGLLGGALMQIIVALAPILVVLVNALGQILPPIVGLLVPLGALVIALMPIILLVAQLAGVLVQLLVPVIVLVISWFSDLVGFIIEAVTAVVKFITDHWKMIAIILGIILLPLGLIIGTVVLLSTTWNVVMSALGTAVSWLWNTVLKPTFGFIVTSVQAVGSFFTWLRDQIGTALRAIGALFTWLYQNVVQPAVTAIGVALTWMGNVLAAVFKGIEYAVAILVAIVWVVFVSPIVSLIRNVLAPVFMWLWDSVIKPVFGFIGDIFSWLWDTIIKVIIAVIKAEITAWGAVISWLWDSVIKPVFGFIGDIFSWVWNSVIKVIIASIQAGIEGLGRVFQWLYDNVIKPVWDAIGAAIRWVWENVIRTAIDAIHAGIDGLGKGFRWLLDNVVRPVWTAIGDAVRFFWDKIVSPIFKWIVDRAHDVGDAFVKFGQTVGGIWDGLKRLIHDGIQGVINLVWNNGLRPVVNAVVKWIPGLSELPRFDVPQFAGGGVLPGYGPGRDTVAALLSPGEAVLVPELVRMLGPEVILAANAAAARGRTSGFSSGGLVAHFADGGIAGFSGAASAGDVASAANAVPMPTPADLKAIDTAATAATVALLALAASVNTALIPAQLSISTTVNNVVVPTLQLAILHTGTLLPHANDALVANTLVSWTRITATIVNAENTVTARQADFQNFLNASWVAIANSVDQSVGRQGAAFGSLQGGLAAVRDAVGFTANWVHDRFLEMQGHAGAPVHWILQFPFNAGLIAAWNKLDADFALNKHVNNVPIPFAAGGRVFGPGSGTSDSVAAWLSNGEYVIPEAIASKTMPFLDALRDGMPEAMQAAGYGTTYATGGLVADTGGQLNATILRGQNWLRQQAGKPYIWGGAGPQGYDCSGLVAALTNVLRGESNPFHRLGVAENQPWPGFVPGLSSAFASGFNSHHTAATLSGVNLEARDFGIPVLVGGAAAGADSGQFTGHASLPVVGGRFIPGGGGAAFDPAAVVNPAFDATYRMIGEITTRFAGTMAALGQGEATKATDAVKAFALAKIAAVAGPGAAIGGDAKAAQDYARTQLARFGWGAEQMNPLTTLWNKESGWNWRALNASSGATGIPQALPGSKMASAGPDWLTNPATQVNWGLGYIKDRYGSPGNALSWHLGHNWYDNGGIVPQGTTVVHNGTSGPEALLTGQQWTDIRTLATQRAVEGPHVTVHARTDASPEHIAAVTSRSVQQAMRTG